MHTLGRIGSRVTSATSVNTISHCLPSTFVLSRSSLGMRANSSLDEIGIDHILFPCRTFKHVVPLVEQAIKHSPINQKIRNIAIERHALEVNCYNSMHIG